MYKMSAGYACVLMKMLSAQGLDVDHLCQESGLDTKLTAIPGSFCERSTIYRLLGLAAQASGDPDIGLKSAEHFHPGMFQIVGYT
ncbi:AraC family transcriptional regulator ligand-binding domain-containing protein, partial [Pseudomonas neuropathica]